MRRGGERSFCGHAETIRQPAYHPHVRTQQGRVNAQQGRCPLNLKGFLATTRASKSSDFDDRFAIRRVPNDSKSPRDRYVSKMRSSDRSADLRTVSHDEKKMAGYTRTPLFIRNGHRDSTSTRGFPAFPESYAFFFLPIARDRIIADLDRLFPELRTSNLRLVCSQLWRRAVTIAILSWFLRVVTDNLT